MFELSVALRYLIPKRGQLSLTIVGSLALFVVTLVVCLCLVFFSVITGIEENWLEKVTTLNASLRLNPTEAYFASYYYKIDQFALAADFSTPSLFDKMQQSPTPIYDPLIDEALPINFPAPDLQEDGSIKPIAQTAYQILNELAENHGSFCFDHYQAAGALLRLNVASESGTKTLTSATYVASCPAATMPFHRLKMAMREVDFKNSFDLLARDALAGKTTSTPSWLRQLEGWQVQPREKCWSVLLRNLHFDSETISIPCFSLLDDDDAISLLLIQASPEEGLPWNLAPRLSLGRLSYLSGKGWRFSCMDRSWLLDPETALHIYGSLILEASLGETDSSEIVVQGLVFENPFHALIDLGRVEWVAGSQKQLKNTLFCPTCGFIDMPHDHDGKTAVLLAKSFQSAGVMVGDTGTINLPNAAAKDSAGWPIVVAGFYDPGFIPVGTRAIFAPRDFVQSLNVGFAPSAYLEKTQAEGFLIWCPPAQVLHYKKLIEQKLEKSGISAYWKLQTFADYEQVKELLLQFRSDRALFIIVGILVLLVACASIVSLLFLLVYDKKKEIALMVALGVRWPSLLSIFSLCAIFIGLIGFGLGSLLAWLAIQNLEGLIAVLGLMPEGSQAPLWGSFRATLDAKALVALFFLVPFISWLAALCPAWQACRLMPIDLLKGER